MSDIKFGTDGWRDRLADGFTFDRAALVARAVCDYVLEARADGAGTAAGAGAGPAGTAAEGHAGDEPHLVIGYDTRFMAERFAALAAGVAAAAGIKVSLSDRFVTTPAVSLAVVEHEADGAIIFTASHNPPIYQGLKFKASFGGSASNAVTERIEAKLEELMAATGGDADVAGRAVERMPLDAAEEAGLVERFNPLPAYVDYVTSFADATAIAQSASRVVADSLYGTGQGVFMEALERVGCVAEEIHGGRDPLFGGLYPEPIPPHTDELARRVVEGGFDLGLALDGDADRLGAVDSRGRFVNSHQIFAVLLGHLVERRGARGEVVKTVSTTQMVDILAVRYKLAVTETPIGFKYIGERMVEGDVLIGGEESGGIGIGGYLPERDGILIGLMLLEAAATEGAGAALDTLVDQLTADLGDFRYDRIDVEIRPAARERVREGLRALEPGAVAGVEVAEIVRIDGFKYVLADGSWLMIRPSGTEAVVRIYAEAIGDERVRELLEEGRRMLEEIVG